LCEKSWNYKTPESIVALNELSLDLWIPVHALQEYEIMSI
jgi:hypothetical protein